MATFSYTARSNSGDKTSGTLEATDRRSALMQLERQGCVPINVSESTATPARSERAKARKDSGSGRDRMKMREVLDFTTELSDLLSAGMKLSLALGTMAARRENAAGGSIICQVRDEINHGSSLSEALAQHPRTFSRLYVNLIRAGEASGALAEILERLTEHYEQVQESREKVVMAMVYPSFIIAAGILTVVFMMAYVIPNFSQVFDDLGSTLPLPTKMLIGISDAVVKYWWAALAVLAVGGVLIYRALQTQRGRAWWDAAQLRIPLVKGIITASAYSHFARTLRTLLSNGVTVLNALAIVEQTMSNSVIAREIRNARERVTDGTTISGPLAAGKVFPSLLTDMLAVGEQTGDMPGALGHIARRYGNELDRRVKIMLTALEPILIFVIAIVVGFIAISMLLAVFDLTSGLNV